MSTNHAHSPAVEADIKSRESFNHVWWLPLIALLLIAYIGISHYTSQGPLITITFKNAEGLEAGKAKVRYKEVTIGMVEKVTLNDNLKMVDISVRMDKSSEGLLRENTQFWIVKPRVGITQVSGLNTLLSGNYLAIEPDTSPDSPFRYEYTGLETPPIINENEPGLKITLLSPETDSLHPGSQVYYKGISVGTVNRVYFSDDYLWVKADIFIVSPHDKLIGNTTKFWNRSGISVKTSADGIEVKMASLESIIAGGVTFDTPTVLPSLHNSQARVADGTEYLLYANEKAANAQISGHREYFVTYFDGNIKGLEVGAPVMIQGMKIGKVKDIQLLFDEQAATTRIPILFEIYDSRLSVINPVDDKEKLHERMIRDGLRTQLETASLITGAKYVSLVFTDQHLPNDTLATITDPITGYVQIPSTAQGFAAITSGVTKLINKVNQLPLNDIADSLNDLLKTADKQVSGLDLDETVTRVNQLLANAENKINQLALEQTITELNDLLKAGKSLSKTAKNTLKGLNESVSDLAKATEATMDGLSPNAPLYHNLNQTLEQLNDTLDSLKAVTDMLERKPNSLIFGESKPKKYHNRQRQTEQERRDDQ